LEEENPRCPECGLEHAAFKPKKIATPAPVVDEPKVGATLTSVPLSPDAN
jgi:hypothetical protein